MPRRSGEISVPLLKASLVLFAFAAAGVVLARLGRACPGPWANLGALLLGPRDSLRVGIDLRFAAFTGGIAVLLVAVVAFPTVFRALSPGELIFATALGLPLVACGLATVADVTRRFAPGSWTLERAAAPSTEPLGSLLNDARVEVERALSRVEDPGRVAALEALTEAVTEYDRVICDRNGETARHLRKSLDQRIRGVITLARSCVDEERREASEVLGVRVDASSSEIAEVFSALTDTYEGLSGADPAKLVELRAAYESLASQPERAAA